MERRAPVSLQLVLQNYLASLKERNELDVLLPELLKAMGHSVLSRPQIGVGQAGVDVHSTYVDAQGDEHLYIFIIKFGDIRREDLFGDRQAILPSVREAYMDFAANRLSAAERSLPKHLVVVSSGGVKQEATSAWKTIVDEVNQQPGFTFEFWGIDQLTPLIEKYIFDESLLLQSGQSDLRAALAGLEDTQASINRFIRFVEACFVAPPEELQQAVQTRKKKFLRRCAAAAMGYGVLVAWGKSENNLKPAAVGGEYLALRLWAKAVELGFESDDEFQSRLATTIGLHLQTLLDYFAKILPSLKNIRAVVRHRPEQVFYAQLAFEEIGRLGTLLLVLQHDGANQQLRTPIANELVELINLHTVSAHPLLDDQSIDLSLAMAALMGEGRIGSVKELLKGALFFIKNGLDGNTPLPVDTDLLEDAIALHTTKSADGFTFFKTSTLIPMLASVAAFVSDEQALAVIRGLAPQLTDVTLERWYPKQGLETHTGSKTSIQGVSASRLVAAFEETTAAEAQSSLRTAARAASQSDFKWHALPWEVLVALSSRLHRHPLPTWYLHDSLARVGPANHEPGEEEEISPVQADPDPEPHVA
jgi:hypothetical protein